MACGVDGQSCLAGIGSEYMSAFHPIAAIGPGLVRMNAFDPKLPLIIENDLDFIGYHLSRGALSLAAQTAEKQALYIARHFEQQRTKKATPTFRVWMAFT